MPSAPVIFEYDPATGQTLATSIPEDLLPLSLSDIAEDGPPAAGLHVASVLDPVEPQLRPEVMPARVVPSLPPNIPPKASPKNGEPRILNEAGKAKVSRAVKQAASMEDFLLRLRKLWIPEQSPILWQQDSDSALTISSHQSPMLQCRWERKF